MEDKKKWYWLKLRIYHFYSFQLFPQNATDERLFFYVIILCSYKRHVLVKKLKEFNFIV